MSLIVTIDYDSHAPCPSDTEGWRLHSFCQRHASFTHPEKLGLGMSLNVDGLPAIKSPGLRQKLTRGLAHFLSYYEHGRCWWGRRDGPIPTGVEFRWDGARVAGLLIWELKASALGPKDYEGRAKDADEFLRDYTAWANGEVYCWTLESETGPLDYDGSSYEDVMLDRLAYELARDGREYEVRGEASFLADNLRRRLEEMAPAHLVRSQDDPA